MTIHSHSAPQTKKIGARLARFVIKKYRSRGARVLALVGELGSGKTTFVQGLARGLGVKKNVLSPTFILMQPFELDISIYRHVDVSRFWHVDCYRLEKPADLLVLGLPDMVKDPRNIVAVEWADKIKELLPGDTLWIYFKHGEKEKERIITVKASPVVIRRRRPYRHR